MSEQVPADITPDQHLLDHPHHDGSARYVSDPNPQLGDIIEVSLLVPGGPDGRHGPTSVHLRFAPDGEGTFVRAEPMGEDADGQWWTARLPIHNPITSYRFLLEGGELGYAWLNGTGLHNRDVPDAADFRILAGVTPPPEWSGDAVVYQVFPDRFARSSARDAARDAARAAGDAQAQGYEVPSWAIPAEWEDPVAETMPAIGTQLYGGDLDGVAEHLDHLVDLGVDVLYLTPFFPGRSNHRYDASTFAEVDPILGGNEALARLTAAAHERGLKVMGDFTTNHTGAGHEWFRSALADPTSEYASYYFMGDEYGADRTTPWAVWPDPELHARGDVPPYVGWLGVGSLPKLNYDSPQVWRAIFDDEDGVVRKWLRPPYGLDGWRVDVANMTARQGAQHRNLEVARRMREVMHEVAPDTLLVGEHTHDFTRDVPGDGWHGVMNYAGFIRPLWTWLHDPDRSPRFLGSPLRVPWLPGAAVAETIREFAALTPWTVLTHSFTLLGSHDTSRFRSLVADPAFVDVGAGALLTMPGIPMIPYGDEIGMEGVNGEDGRRPMPWSAAAAVGAVGGSVGGAAGGGAHWDTRILATYRRLLAIRREHPALRTGGMRWAFIDRDVLAYLREDAAESVLVVLSRAAADPVRLPLGPLGALTADGSVRAIRGLHGSEPAIADGELRMSVDGPGVTLVGWTR